MKILFYDLTAPFAYTVLTLKQQALRGTEASIVRIAHALQHYHTVYIAQQCRSNIDNQLLENVHYISLERAHDLIPDSVILIRDYRGLQQTCNQFPKARHFFWLHNLPARNLHASLDILTAHKFTIIAVSNFQRAIIKKRLRGKWYQRLFAKSQNIIPVQTIYNPIDDDLKPDSTIVKAKQMIFTSSIHKGLDLTLKSFAKVQAQFPEYELLIITPESLKQGITLPKQVSVIASLPMHQLIKHVRESFCVFYPQTKRVETFGFVYAEANAVGTPVLAHHFGAAKEVLSNPTQLIDGHNPKQILEKIIEWRRKRPSVELKEEFRLKHVVQKWLELFDSRMST